jgi:hypothetical protein
MNFDLNEINKENNKKGKIRWFEERVNDRSKHVSL